MVNEYLQVIKQNLPSIREVVVVEDVEEVQAMEFRQAPSSSLSQVLA